MKDMDCSKDIVQDLLVNLWHSDIRFASGRELMGYLYKSLYNNSLLYIRNKKKRAMILDKIDQEKENEDFSKDFMAGHRAGRDRALATSSYWSFTATETADHEIKY